ncbi:T9SS type A sorting domain-containing protein [Labilibacter sediminis]|nr:T9SS type A sorting domain-containing protein [Labilibacter sediminis]
MRTILSLFLISIACITSAQIPNTSLDNLKVMTWNVWYGFSQLEVSAGILPSDHPYIATQAEVQQKATNFLLSEAPDVLALQELKNFDPNKLSTFAQSYGHNYSYIFDRDTQQPTGITSKYPIEFLEGNNGDYNGTNLEGTFAAKLTNEPVVFIVVHLKSANKNHREKETKYVLELYEKYMDMNNHVIILGDFNSMTITDRTYAESNIDKRLQYRIFKSKCTHELNRANEPDNGMVACTTWDYRMMDKYWDYSTYNIIDVTDQYADRATYETNKLWGTFPSSSVSMFHDESNLDHDGNSTTTHTHTEHLARIDYILASEALANKTANVRIIHNYVTASNHTVLIDEMTDHYPVVATFHESINTSVGKNDWKKEIVFTNPVSDLISFNHSIEELSDYSIYSISGALIQKGDISHSHSINVEYLSKGLYLLKLNNANAYKFIKR